MGKLKFTASERTKLKATGIKVTKLDDYSLDDFFKALQPSTERMEQISRMFYDDDRLKLAEPIYWGQLAKNMSSALPGYSSLRLPNPLSTSFLDRVAPASGGAFSFLRMASELNTRADLILAPSVNSVATRIAESVSVQLRGIDSLTRLSDLATAMSKPLADPVSRLRVDVFPFIGRLRDDTKISNSLLDVSRYKTLGIGLLAESFASSNIERLYAGSLGNSILAAADFTRLGEASLSQFNWTSVGSKLNISATLAGAAQNKFLTFSRDYRDVMEVIRTKPNWLYDAPALAELPSQEYFTSSQILRIVSDQQVSAEQIADETGKAEVSNQDYLIEYLARLDPDLPRLWDGAVYVLRSDSPDNIRQFITSLRELFTHVLHILSPDQDFARWDTVKTYYHKDRPTRKGRLCYICRNMDISNIAFANFMQSDIDSAIALINLFHSGTHKIRTEYSHHELEMILLRSELSLRTVLRVEFDINRL